MQCSIFTLSANQIRTVLLWSVFEEILRYLSFIDFHYKKEFIFQCISFMGFKIVLVIIFLSYCTLQLDIVRLPIKKQTFYTLKLPLFIFDVLVLPATVV